jgi:hypothetical protein
MKPKKKKPNETTQEDLGVPIVTVYSGGIEIHQQMEINWEVLKKLADAAREISGEWFETGDRKAPNKLKPEGES